MAAARPRLAVVPSGAGRAWSTEDAPLRASSSFLDLRSTAASSSAPGPSSAVAKCKVPAAQQPNVKKMRRRVALLSGVHLNLPSSPVVGPSPPGSSREMAWTFTAEWDSTQDEIVFSEVESGSSSASPSSSSNLRAIASPIPSDVDEEELYDLEVLSAPPVVAVPPRFSDIMLHSSPSSPSSSGVSSPCSSAVSDIFEFYMRTPSTGSYHHQRNGSVSTAPSSPLGPPSPAESSLPPYSDGPPLISVTFYEENEHHARAGPVMRSHIEEPAPDSDYAPTPEKSRVLPPAPHPRYVAKRPLPPLPPLPIRSASTTAIVAPPLAKAQPRPRPVWDERPATTPRPLTMGAQQRQRPSPPPSAYSPPSPGPMHTRAASLGRGQVGRPGGPPKRGGLGRHFRSISAVLTGSLHRHQQ
ncbi:hypothetical protein BD413DRAFT_494837 [Trametes elegans]|nr:hypothetical protein BD413DRAFT_494837 [Trametes elegans]